MKSIAETWKDGPLASSRGAGGWVVLRPYLMKFCSEMCKMQAKHLQSCLRNCPQPSA